MLLSRPELSLASLTFSQMTSLFMMVNDENAIKLMALPTFNSNIVDEDWCVDDNENAFVLPNEEVDVGAGYDHFKGDDESLLGWFVIFDRPALVDALLRTPDLNVNRRHGWMHDSGDVEHLHPALLAAQFPRLEYSIMNSSVCLQSILAHPEADIRFVLIYWRQFQMIYSTSHIKSYYIRPKSMMHLLRHSTIDIHKIEAREWDPKDFEESTFNEEDCARDMAMQKEFASKFGH